MVIVSYRDDVDFGHYFNTLCIVSSEEEAIKLIYNLTNLMLKKVPSFRLGDMVFNLIDGIYVESNGHHKLSDNTSLGFEVEIPIVSLDEISLLK